MIRVLFLWLAVAVAANAVELKPYEMIWRADGDVLADLSFLHDAPAGKDGFVTVRGGHLAKGNGDRLRLWGVNFSFTASLPSKDTAQDVAAHLARFGINCVRVHHLDWRTPRGIIDSKFRDSRHLDPEMLDRLDNFVAELKKRGIYTNLNLNVARAFQEGDGVKDASQLGFAKAMTYFDPRMIELQQEYARTLLTHRNPYTGNEYRHEPSVAIVEIVNENSLIESWKAGRLQGKGPSTDADKTWSDIPASYARDLDRLYAEWLVKKATPEQLAKLREESGEGVLPRLRPDQFKTASALRFQLEESFYIELEDRFFETMGRFLKQDLGVKCPITGTSVHNGGISPYPLLSSTAKLDVVDAHTYWQHPRYLSDPATGRRTGFEIPNTPALKDLEQAPIMNLSRAAVAGKPFMVSEVNHPYPNEYAAEGIPLLTAYAAFHDWDAIFWYSFSHSPAEAWSKPGMPGHFDMRQDPVKMTQWAAAALLFLRGDVAPARTTVPRSYSWEQVVESLRLPGDSRPFFTPGFPAWMPLVHATRIASFDGRPFEPVELAKADPIVSDTGQLRWLKAGVATVDTARTQSVIGYTKLSHQEPANLAVQLENEFAAVTLVSLDSAPIAKADRLLLSAAARVANRGMVWNEKRTSVINDGEPGILIEPVAGSITLKGLEGAKAVEVQALDGAGRALGRAIPGAKSDAGWELKIGATVTPWYLILVTR